MQDIETHIKHKNYDGALELATVLMNNNDVEGYYSYIKIKLYLATKINNIKEEIEYFNIFNHIYNITNIIITDENKYVNYIVEFLNSALFRGYIQKQHKYYYYNANEQKIVENELPFNFSYVCTKNNKIAGSSIPKIDNMDLLQKIGVTDIITCLEEKTNLDFEKYNIKNHFFAINDRTPPTIEQMDQIVSIIDISKNVIVHCLGGIGRTNTVLICYLLYRSIKNKDLYGSLTVSGAIDYVTNRRPTIKLTKSQSEFIKKYASYCFQHQHTPNNNIKPLVKLPKIIMFSGYPGSGKSTLSMHVCDNIGIETIRINQDEMGRTKCYEIFNDNIKNDSIIIIDNCNLTKDKRKEWIKLSLGYKLWCIQMITPLEECQYRINIRKNHPTVKNGSKVLESVDRLEDVEENEGFEKIFKISSENDYDIEQLLNIMGISEKLVVVDEENMNIIKFPRTKHLINLGSATKDDRICTKDELQMFLNTIIYLEEKIDGANLGISINRDGKILVQNRSHYVNSSYHAQFKPLDKWIAKHTDELFSILEPEIEILYGEWIYMKHSINYTKLPDYFMAFDIFNKKNGKFLSRQKVSEKLNGTSIIQVPLVETKKFTKVEEIQSYLKQQSYFYNGLLEGIYIRICDDEHTLERAKLVRTDFISGNTHWKNNKIVINELSNKY